MVKLNNKRFKELIYKLKQYIEDNGSYPISNPKNDASELEKELGYFIKKIRDKSKSGFVWKYLNEDRTIKNEFSDSESIKERLFLLEEMNFEWNGNLSNDKFRNNIENLKKFIEENDRYPTSSSNNEEELELWFFVRQCRDKTRSGYILKYLDENKKILPKFKNDDLINERLKLLEGITFDWNKSFEKEKRWDFNFSNFLLETVEKGYISIDKWMQKQIDLADKNLLNDYQLKTMKKYYLLEKPLNKEKIINNIKDRIENGHIKSRYLELFREVEKYRKEIDEQKNQEKLSLLAEQFIYELVNKITKRNNTAESAKSQLDKLDLSAFFKNKLDFERFKESDIEVLIKDVKNIIDIGYQVFGKRWSIVDLNEIQKNNKGYDFYIASTKNGKINPESEKIMINYKFKIGQSFANVSFDSLVKIQWSQIEETLEEKTKEITLEADKHIKNITNIDDLIIDKLEALLATVNKTDSFKIVNRSLPLVHYMKENIENYTTFEFLDEVRHIKEVPEFNDSIDRLIQFGIYEIIGPYIDFSKINKKELLKEFKKWIKDINYFSENALSNENTAKMKYIIKEIYRDKDIISYIKEEKGLDFTAGFHNLIAESLSTIVSDNLSKINEDNDKKISVLKEILHLKDDYSILVGDGEVIELPQLRNIKLNLNDIKIEIDNWKGHNSGVHFDIKIKLKGEPLIELIDNNLKSKKGMLIGALSPDLSRTNNLTISENINKILFENIEKSIKKEKTTEISIDFKELN